MGSNTRVDRSIGKKFGGLLEGLLGGLYDTSSLVANTDFNTDAPISLDSGNVPYSGSGLFGGIKAKGANAQFAAQNAMANLNSKRQLSYLKESLPIQNDAALALLKSQNELADAHTFKQLGDKGAALGIALSNLPAGQMEMLGAPATFKSPQEQANWYQQAYGALPVVEAPLKALNLSNQLKVQARPEVLNSLVNQEINKGLTTVGDSKVDITGKTVYEGSGTDYQENLIPITKQVLNPITGNIEDQTVGYKTERIPRRRQAGVMNLADYRITPEDVAATSGVGNNANANANANVNQPQIQQPTDPFISTDIAPKPIAAKPAMTPQPETAVSSGSNLEGIIPNLVEGGFGFPNLLRQYQQNIAQPLAPTVTAGAETLGQAASGVGDVLGNIRKFFIRSKGEQYTKPKFVDIGDTSTPGLDPRPLDIIPKNTYTKPPVGSYPPIDLTTIDPLQYYGRELAPMVSQPQSPQLTEEQLQALIAEINAANKYGQKRYGKPAAIRQPIAVRPMSEFQRK